MGSGRRWGGVVQKSWWNIKSGASPITYRVTFGPFDVERSKVENVLVNIPKFFLA